MSSTQKLPRAVLLALAGILSAGLVATVALVGGGAAGPGPIVGPAPSGSESADAADPRTATFDERDRAENPRTEEEVGRTEVETLAVAGDGPLLSVVEAATSRPVPGAEVFFADERELRFDGRNRGHWSLRVMDSDNRTIADAQGHAAMPPVQRRLFVVARTAGLFGVTMVQRGATEATVALETDHTLTVRVTDGDGRPRADVDVVLCTDRVQRLDAQASAPTDAAGIAEIPHIQLYRSRLPQVDPAVRVRAEQLLNQLATMEQAARGERAVAVRVNQDLRVQLESARRELQVIARSVRDRERSARAEGATAPLGDWADFVVGARVPQVAPAVVRFPSNAVPTGVVDLRVGAVGSLAVRLVGPDGAPLWPSCSVVVRRSGSSAPPMGIEPALADSLRRISEQRSSKPVGDELVRFDPIGAGSLLDVRVEFRDNDFNFEQNGVQGPLAGEEAVVEIAVPGWFAVLSGRLVDAEGRPWSELRTELLVTGAAGRIEGEPVTTGADGRFELPVKLRQPSPPYALEVQARLGDDPLGALVAVPAVEVGRRHDLGDLVVGPLPVLAQGTVRDDRGEPLGAVDLILQTFAPGAGEGGGWSDVAYVRARSGDDGIFRLYGERRNESMRIRARARGHARVDSPQFSFGATVDLTLTRLGNLVATGHAPEWLPRGAVELVLSQGGRRVRSEGLRLRQDGAFRATLGGLEPGRYDLAFTLRGIGTVVEQPAITIAPGDTTTLPEFELRNSVFRYELRAQDQNGQPVRDPGSPLLAQIVDPGGTLRWVGFPWRGDRVEFFSTSRSAMVVGLAGGRVPVRTEIAPGESLLTFAQLNPIELELTGLRALVGERRVRVSLVFEGDTGLPMDDFQAVDQRRGRDRGYPRASLGKSSGAWLGQNDTVRVPLMLNGRYRVVARISEAGKRGNVSKDVGVIDAVLDGPQLQRVLVVPPPAIVQQALAELAAR